MAECLNCGASVNIGVTRCVKCGSSISHAPPAVPAASPQGSHVAQAPATPVQPVQPVQHASVPNVLVVSPPKSRMAYIMLGIFLGYLGVHNFYAGYAGRGVAQLLISVVGGILTCGLSLIPVVIWNIIEICITDRDAKGVPFS